jgi:uncharacterized protein
MRTFFFSLVALFALSLALPAKAEDPAITTTGTSTVYAVPDKAVFSVSLNDTDGDITKACTRNNADADKFVKAVKAAGIADADIATNTLSISPHYRRISGGESERDGYTASRSYAITLHDLKQIEKVFTAMVQSGVEALPSVSLEVTDTRPYRDQARTLALKAAREKAIAMAKELDCTVGKAHNIVEGHIDSGTARYSNFASNSMAIATDRPTPDTPESTPIGKIQIQATVTVTFELK